MTSISSIGEVLDQLGISYTGDANLRALCPVHHLATGRNDTHPSWYINSETGAWICFSCHQRGSLRTLLELMEIDDEILGRVPIEVMKSKVKSWAAEDIDETDDKETVYVSRYGFLKNPTPPKLVRTSRGVSRDVCDEYDVRWDKEGKCWLLPIYGFDGTLLGWQEKSKGYFMNVPDDVKKTQSLFGFQHLIHNSCGIIVESPLDVLKLASLNLLGGLAIYGSFASDAQLEAIARQCGRVILALDDDKAGINCRNHMLGVLRTAGVPTKMFQYPSRDSGVWGKDIGDLGEREIHLGLLNATSFVRI